MTVVGVVVAAAIVYTTGQLVVAVWIGRMLKDRAPDVSAEAARARTMQAWGLL